MSAASCRSGTRCSSGPQVRFTIRPRCTASRALSVSTQRSTFWYSVTDWDGLRELISADARLLVADRFSGRFTDAGYLGVYERMRVAWRLAVGELNGEPSIVLLNLRDGGWEIAGIIRLDLNAEGRIQSISDYQHCPWTLTAGSIVVRESTV